MSSGVALVLSGGGAKGAFQFGAIQYIEEHYKKKNPTFNYSIIAGVSVGALNGTMLAMEKYELLKEIWNTISSEKVYRGSLNWLAAIRVLFGSRSVLSNKPLYELIKKHVSLRDIKSDRYDLRIGSVSLYSGEYRAFRPQDFENDDEFRKVLLSSTAIPVIWKPVNEIRLKNGSLFRDAIDGGIRNISPLGDVIDSDPEEVIIINCSAYSLRLKEDPKASKNIFKIAKRALVEIAIDEIFNSDISEFLRINRLVEQAEKQNCQLLKPDGRPYRSFRTVLIQPDGDLGDTLDFSERVIKERIEKGFQVATKAFETNHSI
ncbi:MAG: patatin-like phospholipase family protein [Thermodesulfovibrionales bacterium]|nr:patatin-like phospholipase family protein [Thermodesulfovibrionales bacterium]